MTVTGAFPLGTCFVYARTVSPTGVQGPLVVAGTQVTSHAYVFPTSFTYVAPTMYASAATTIGFTFSPAETVGAMVAVFYHTTSTSTAPTQCGTGTVSSSSGAASVACTFPTAGTYYIYAMVTSPSGRQGSLLRATATVVVNTPHSVFFPAGVTHCGEQKVALSGLGKRR